ncbi:MAG: hypothetical protein OEM96_06250 [Gemmatimonadota bacterium]|nr:hypothetical protein [Gemmatimonadota bacterium]
MGRTDVQRTGYEPTQLARVQTEYAIRRRRQAISTIPVGALGLAVTISGGGLFGLGGSAVLVVVGAVVLSFFGFSVSNWRCPACDRYLGQRLNPSECPSCGQALRK